MTLEQAIHKAGQDMHAVLVEGTINVNGCRLSIDDSEVSSVLGKYVEARIKQLVGDKLNSSTADVHYNGRLIEIKTLRKSGSPKIECLSTEKQAHELFVYYYNSSGVIAIYYCEKPATFWNHCRMGITAIRLASS